MTQKRGGGEESSPLPLYAYTGMQGLCRRPQVFVVSKLLLNRFVRDNNFEGHRTFLSLAISYK